MDRKVNPDLLATATYSPQQNTPTDNDIDLAILLHLSFTKHMNSLESNGRSSPDTWLDLAYETLISKGIDAVRIMPLAKQLNLSRTSFYWYFKDREALLDALIGRWKAKNTHNLIQQTQAYSESITEAVLNLFDCWLYQTLFDSGFEFAMRNWALQSEEVDVAVKKADEDRISAIQRMFTAQGYTTSDADVRARTLYLTQIGYVCMRSNEPVDVRMARIADYAHVFTGVTPTESELKRFFHRHAFT